MLFKPKHESQQNSPPPGRWVKCNDRMPERAGWYITNVGEQHSANFYQQGVYEWWEWTYKPIFPAAERDENELQTWLIDWLSDHKQASALDVAKAVLQWAKKKGRP